MAIILCAECHEAFIVDLDENFTIPLLIEKATKVGLKLDKGDFVCPACEERAHP